MTPAALIPLLSEAAEHRRKGDLGAALVAEMAAQLALRSAQELALIKTPTTDKEAR